MCNLKVSIVCITYNHEKYIRKTLDSLVSQKTNFNYEIIIHDDASTDNTVKEILKYSKKYPNIIKLILQTENQMQKKKSPLHICFEKAKGEYIAICEGDDYWTDENKIAMQVEVLDSNNNIVGCGHNAIIVDDDGNPSKMSFDLKYNKDTILNIKDLKLTNRFAHTCSIMFKKNVCFNMSKQEKIDYLSIKALSDEKISALMSVKGDFYFISKYMSAYRFVVNDNMSYSATTYKYNMCSIYVDNLNNIEAYTKKYYNVSKQYSYRRALLFWRALYLYSKNHNLENKHIYLKLKKDNKNNKLAVFKVFFLMFYWYIKKGE